jgi:RNA polymerase sigma-70 factor (ECF subfamily)
MAAVLDTGFAGTITGAARVSALHQQLRGPLQRFFATYRLNAADADDLTQEVFLRLVRPGQTAQLRNPVAFAFTLARNLVRDRARRLHTRCAQASVAIEDVDLPCGMPTPEQALEQLDRLKAAESVLASLKPNARDAFLLRRVCGYEYADIAACMGVSVSMVEKHMMAATAALREADD